jgi:hypothetical protein
MSLAVPGNPNKQYPCGWNRVPAQHTLAWWVVSEAGPARLPTSSRLPSPCDSSTLSQNYLAANFHMGAMYVVMLWETITAHLPWPSTAYINPNPQMQHIQLQDEVEVVLAMNSQVHKACYSIVSSTSGSSPMSPASYTRKCPRTTTIPPKHCRPANLTRIHYSYLCQRCHCSSHRQHFRHCLTETTKPCMPMLTLCQESYGNVWLGNHHGSPTVNGHEAPLLYWHTECDMTGEQSWHQHLLRILPNMILGSPSTSTSLAVLLEIFLSAAFPKMIDSHTENIQVTHPRDLSPSGVPSLLPHILGGTPPSQPLA